MLKDNVKACRLLEDGTYKRVKNKEPELNSQELFFQIIGNINNNKGVIICG